MQILKTLVQSNFSTVVAEYEDSRSKEESYESEAQLENKFINILKNQGYEYFRASCLEDLKNNLRVQIQKLNDISFSDSEWERFYRSVIAKSGDSVRAKAKKIQEDYKQSFIFDNGVMKNINLLDKTNIHKNVLQVINQYETEGKYKNRYDVSILVNGLPLVHIELKRRGVDIKEAYNQIDRYARESFFAGDGIFGYVQIFVISNGTYTKYYSNTIREDHTGIRKSDNFEFTSFWADSKNKAILDLTSFAKTFFARHTLLNILSFYCVFTSDENLLVMRPYQIVATEKILEQIRIAKNTKAYGTRDSGGYIWHTTGSGKTLTSFKTALLASEIDFISRVLFVVDRKDLDYQTMKEYDRFQKGSANSNTNTDILGKQLSDPNARIIITTIQKLSLFIKKNPSHRVCEEEIVIIFDECHRSQFGEMHKSIIRFFKKYYLFGFTGTPIFSQNCDIYQGTTEDRFGRALHKYTIIDAIADKNVLPFNVFYHNTIFSKDGIKDKKVLAIDKQKALLDKERIQKIAEYILQNFSRYTKNEESYQFRSVENINSIVKNKKIQEKTKSKYIKGFNSILACSGIEAVKRYYQAFKTLSHSLKVATIFSYSPNEELDGLEEENSEDTSGLDQSSRDFLESAISDYNKLFDTNYNTSSQGFQGYYKDVSWRMKNKEIDLLIVANMFLTGFDSKTINTLWVDKNLRYHGLLQAFSRTNRILNSIKTFGNIVCFRDLENELNEALRLFGNEEAKGNIILKSYKEYYEGYTQDQKKYEGYKSLIERLKRDYPMGERIISPKAQKEFIGLYGQILKMRNILDCFDEFSEDKLISQRELQDYQSIYLDLYRENKTRVESEKEDICDDIVFEIELIKQVEVNIDYILDLITKYTEAKDKEIRGSVKKEIELGINSSLEMRNKKDLILDFLNQLNLDCDAKKEFYQYAQQKRKEELQKIIKDYQLEEKKTYKFIEQAFETGSIDFKGTNFPEILPRGSSYFSENASESRGELKNKISKVLQDFFDRYYSISSKLFES